MTVVMVVMVAVVVVVVVMVLVAAMVVVVLVVVVLVLVVVVLVVVVVVVAVVVVVVVFVVVVIMGEVKCEDASVSRRAFYARLEPAFACRVDSMSQTTRCRRRLEWNEIEGPTLCSHRRSCSTENRKQATKSYETATLRDNLAVPGRGCPTFTLPRHGIESRMAQGVDIMHAQDTKATISITPPRWSCLQAGRRTCPRSSLASSWRCPGPSVAGYLPSVSTTPLARWSGGPDVHGSSLISQVPQCTPTLFLALSCMAMRTAPSGSVC